MLSSVRRRGRLPAAPFLFLNLTLGLFSAFPDRAAAQSYSVFPADGSTVPSDAPIRLAFPFASRAGTTGALRIKAANGSPAYILDIGRLASGTLMARVGSDNLAIRPVVVEGGEAYLSVSPGALEPGATYTAEIDAGAFSDADGQAYPAASWTFKTAARPIPA